VVREGKYHQVRRMLAARGKPVTYLKRLREGSLTLGDLPLGETRLLTPEEVAQLL
jgi:16S rRNA pseudouridine516 synthase